MSSIALASVRVPRGRRPLGDIAALAASISVVGLLQPIVVTKEHVLIAGHHRLKACKSLGWSKIAANVVDLNDLDRELAEIDENLLHAPLSALDRADQLARRKEIYLARHPDTKRGTAGAKAKHGTASEIVSFAADAAEKTKQSRRTVEQDVKISTSLTPETKAAVRGTKVEDAKVTLLELARVSDPKTQANVAGRVVSGEAKNVRQALRQVEQERRSALPIEARADRLVLVGNAVELVATLERRPHLVITDPPYGIETHSTRRGGKDYADGKDYALELLRDTCAALKKTCDPSAHLYFCSGYSWAWAFKQILSQFFEVQDNPIVWVKDNHTMCDFALGYPSKYEYIWFAKMAGSRRRLAACVPDVLTVARERESTHSAEKPVALLRTLVEQSSVPGELVVDPFAGSGSTGVAAAQLGRAFVGIDIDQKWAEVARGRIALV